MTRLPTELYINLFALLPQKTKLECALVCSQWTQIALRCLYDHVLIRSQGTLDKFMYSLKTDPSRKRKVNHISLFEPYQFDFDKRELCSMFPNLQSVKLFKYNFSTTDLSNNSIYPSAMNLKSTIKSLDENGTFDFLLYLVESNLCHQLERLHLSCGPEIGNRQIPLHLLKNMPALKKISLGLYDSEFILRDAEIIHKNIPSITNFRFLQAELMESNIPVTLQPNTSIKSISWSFRRINSTRNASETYSDCLRYILKKYTGLKKLYINTKEYTTFLSHDRKYVFEHGWLPLLRSHGPQLQQIGNIDIPENINVFQVLDDVGSKVQDLSICSDILALDEFTHSNQRHHIQTLAMKNIIFKSDVSLKDTKLVQLELTFSLHNTLNLNSFLKVCPITLKSLTMEKAVIDYNGLDDYQYPFLVYLDINKSGTTPVVLGTKEKVCKSCPNLKSLNLLKFA